MTRPNLLKNAVLRREALEASKTVHVAARVKKLKDDELAQQKREQAVAESFRKATLHTSPTKRDKLAPLIDKLTERVEERVLHYCQDNSWTKWDLMEAVLVCDFLLSIDAVDSAPEVQEYVETAVWRQFCSALLDLANINTPIRARYLNGMRQDRYVSVMSEVVETKRDPRPWHSPARRGNVDQILGDLHPKTPPSRPKTDPKPTESQQPETPKQRRVNRRRDAKRPLSLSDGK